MNSSILYVEDDPVQRQLIQEILKRFGFVVTVAGRALDALKYIVDSDFDIAILDYDLPDMTGAQLAQEIRAIQPKIRILVLSGRVSAGELVYVDAQVLKGTPISELVETICSLLPARRAVGSVELHG